MNFVVFMWNLGETLCNFSYLIITVVVPHVYCLLIARWNVIIHTVPVHCAAIKIYGILLASKNREHYELTVGGDENHYTILYQYDV